MIKPVDSDALRGADVAGDRPVSNAARRALMEAAARRSAEMTEDAPRPKEIDGRPGPEPIRYGDWENKGIASDF